jgi:hypothetical protein
VLRFFVKPMQMASSERFNKTSRLCTVHLTWNLNLKWGKLAVLTKYLFTANRLGMDLWVNFYTLYLAMQQLESQYPLRTNVSGWCVWVFECVHLCVHGCVRNSDVSVFFRDQSLVSLFRWPDGCSGWHNRNVSTILEARFRSQDKAGLELCWLEPISTDFLDRYMNLSFLMCISVHTCAYVKGRLATTLKYSFAKKLLLFFILHYFQVY